MLIFTNIALLSIAKNSYALWSIMSLATHTERRNPS